MVKKKHANKNFHGIVPGFLGDFVYVFFSPMRNDPPKKHINKFLPPAQSHDSPGKFVYVYVCGTPRPATGVSRALRARSVSGVSPRVSPKTGGVHRSVRPGVHGARAPECPKT